MTDAPIRIFHLASHARAGETMALRALSCHPRIHVPVQVTQQEDPESFRLVQEIRSTEIGALSPDHWYCRAKSLTPRHVLLVKQGVWEPRRPFSGVVLIRNPLSFVHSMLEYNRREGLSFALRQTARYTKTMERLLRWSRAMSDKLVRELETAVRIVDALCAFYRYRVSWLTRTGLPLVRYEELVTGPEAQLRRICQSLGVEWSEEMLRSHVAYEGQEGHGMNDLTRPVDNRSLSKWLELPTRMRADIIVQTQQAAALAGYSLTRDTVTY